MSKTAKRFMRAYPDLWLDEEKIRGIGDDGQREGGIPLDQEGAYWRLCLTQFRQEDGYLPNRRAFLCDAVACPIAEYEKIVVPVLEKFFRRTKDGSRLYNVTARVEWEETNKKTSQAKEANRVRWEEAKARVSSLTASVDPSGHPDGYPDGASKSKRESKRESKSRADHPSGPPKRLAEFERLMAEPEVKAASEFWTEHLGGKVTLGLLRAVRDLLAVAYEPEVIRKAVLALEAATERPEQFHPKSQSRWCLAHNHTPGYVLRPEVVEKLAGEHEQNEHEFPSAQTGERHSGPRHPLDDPSLEGLSPKERAERRAAMEDAN